MIREPSPIRRVARILCAAGALAAAGTIQTRAGDQAPAAGGEDLRPAVARSGSELRTSLRTAISLVESLDNQARGLRSTISDSDVQSFLYILEVRLIGSGAKGGNETPLLNRLQAADAILRDGLQKAQRAPIGACMSGKLADLQASQQGVQALNQATSQIADLRSAVMIEQKRLDEAVKPYLIRKGTKTPMSRFQARWDRDLSRIAALLDSENSLHSSLARLQTLNGTAACGKDPNSMGTTLSAAHVGSGSTAANQTPPEMGRSAAIAGANSGVERNTGAFLEPAPRPADGPVQYMPQQGSLFSYNLKDHGGVSPNAISQGNVNDCYLLTALGAIAQTNPQAVRNLIRQNPDGTYSVTFHRRPDNAPVTIQVDNSLPMQKSGQGYSYLYADPTPVAGSLEKVLYPALIEKAYAKWMGSYDAIDAPPSGSKDPDPAAHNQGILMAEMTGTQSEEEPASSASLVQLADWSRKGYALTVSSDRAYDAYDPLYNNLEDPVPLYDDSGNLVADGQSQIEGETLIPNHKYWVERVDPVHGYVVLRNPWGWGQSHVLLSERQLQQSLYRIEINPLRTSGGGS